MIALNKGLLVFPKNKVGNFLLLALLIYSVFVTVVAVQLKTQVESQARQPAGSWLEHPALQAFLATSEWQAFFYSPEVQVFLKSARFQRIVQSSEWNSLESSFELAGFAKSPEVRVLSDSEVWREFTANQSVSNFSSRVQKKGRLGYEGLWGIQNIWHSSEFSNLLGSHELNQLAGSPRLLAFLRGSELKNFVKVLLQEKIIDPDTGELDPGLKAILKSKAFTNLFESQFGEGSLAKPIRNLISDQVASNDQGAVESGSSYEAAGFLDRFRFPGWSWPGRNRGRPEPDRSRPNIDYGKILTNLFKPVLTELNLLPDYHPFGTSEILRTDAEGKPSLVRVFIPADTDELLGSLAPVYVYLIRGVIGVVVWDASYMYPMSSMLTVFGDLSPAEIIGLLTGDFDLARLMAKIEERCREPEPTLTPMPAAEEIIEAIEKHFPGQGISQILLPHWHVDHVENAPQLQEMALAKWGFRPPLRVGARDKYYPDDDNGDGIAGGEGDSIGGAETVFTQACYPGGSWVWGEDLRDGEAVAGTSYILIASPEHTYGNFRIYSDVDQVGITDGFLMTDESSANPLFTLLRALAENERLRELFKPLMVIFVEDKASSMATWEKYKTLVIDRGYPSLWLHFPDETPADQMKPPPVIEYKILPETMIF